MRRTPILIASLFDTVQKRSATITMKNPSAPSIVMAPNTTSSTGFAMDCTARIRSIWVTCPTSASRLAMISPDGRKFLLGMRRKPVPSGGSCL